MLLLRIIIGFILIVIVITFAELVMSQPVSIPVSELPRTPAVGTPSPLPPADDELLSAFDAIIQEDEAGEEGGQPRRREEHPPLFTNPAMPGPDDAVPLWGENAPLPTMPSQGEARTGATSPHPQGERNDPSGFLGMPRTVESEDVDTFSPPERALARRGVLTPETGGFNEDIWMGISFTRLKGLLENVRKNGVKSPTLRKLLQKALLTRATPPQGGETAKWLAERVRTLTALGYAQAGQSLLEDIDPNWLINMPEMAEAWVENTLVSGNAPHACQFARQFVLNANESKWRRTLLACQALEQNKDGLRLSLELATPEDRLADPLLFQILTAIQQNGDSPRLMPGFQLSPLHEALYAFTPALLTPDVIIRLPDSLLRQISRNSDMNFSQRIQSAEALVTAYAMPADVDLLVSLYQIVSFEPDMLISPINVVKDEPDGSMARALLWQAAGKGQLPSSRALVLKTLWDRAEKDGLSYLPAYLTPTLRGIQPDANLAWFAVHTLKYALRTGNITEARKWWGVLEKSRTLSRDLDAERTELTIALGILEGHTTPADLNGWWQTRRFDKPTQLVDAERTLALTEATGLDVPAQLWLDLHEKFNDANISYGKGPGGIWLRLLGTSVEQRKVGEAVLLLTEASLHTPPSRMMPQGLANMATALRFLGLREEAATLALEGILGSDATLF